ncbi:hypothetical protein DPSP01_006650 [Paraphaeosphaeria sporulosa]
MAEVVGLVASVIQVAGAGLKLSETLYQYAESVASADRRIKDIATEIKLTASTIKELGSLFQQDATSKLLSNSALHTANETVRECSKVFEEISILLNKSKKNTLGRMILPFREPKIELFRSHVDKLKITLQLLTSVLIFAHQTAAREHDRKMLASHREEIKELLQHRKRSTQRYEESVKNYSLSEDSTVLDEEEDTENTNQDPISATSIMMATAAIKSTITVETLNTCVQHVRSLLSNIEALQVALETQKHGENYSEHQQRLIGTYFHARQHLDSAFLGNPQDQPIPNARCEIDSAPLRPGYHHETEGEHEKLKIDRLRVKEDSELKHEVNRNRIEVGMEFERAFDEREPLRHFTLDEKTLERASYISQLSRVKECNNEKNKAAARDKVVAAESPNRLAPQASDLLERQTDRPIWGDRKSVHDPIPVKLGLIERGSLVESELDKVGTAYAFREKAKAAGAFNAGGFMTRAGNAAAKRLEPDEQKFDERRPYSEALADDPSTSDLQVPYRNTSHSTPKLRPPLPPSLQRSTSTRSARSVSSKGFLSDPVSAGVNFHSTPTDDFHNIFDHVDPCESQVDDALFDFDKNTQTQSPNPSLVLERERRPYSRSPGRSDTRENEWREKDEAAESIPKARKRTKTGCLTCRKRRIKCGEERPTCANCIQSKRQCYGYNQRVVLKPPTEDWPNDLGRSDIQAPPSPQLARQDYKDENRERTIRGSASPFLSKPDSYYSPPLLPHMPQLAPIERFYPQLAAAQQSPQAIDTQPGDLSSNRPIMNDFLFTNKCTPWSYSSSEEIAEKRKPEDIDPCSRKNQNSSRPNAKRHLSDIDMGDMLSVARPEHSIALAEPAGDSRTMAELDSRGEIKTRLPSSYSDTSKFRQKSRYESDELDKEVDTLLRDWTTVL